MENNAWPNQNQSVLSLYASLSNQYFLSHFSLYTHMIKELRGIVSGSRPFTLSKLNWFKNDLGPGFIPPNSKYLAWFCCRQFNLYLSSPREFNDQLLCKLVQRSFLLIFWWKFVFLSFFQFIMNTNEKCGFLNFFYQSLQEISNMTSCLLKFVCPAYYIIVLRDFFLDRQTQEFSVSKSHHSPFVYVSWIYS